MVKRKNAHSPSFLSITVPFALCIFLGSFLLFQVQPIIGKYILPWFGGTSAVWTTALLFFQVVLLFGYWYVFLLSKFSLKKQILLHIILLLTITSIIGILFFVWKAPIMPEVNTKLNNTVSPIAQVLGVLFISVGLPYFLLSTTSIVLQKWFSNIRGGESPYLFYALSNAASLLAVLGYSVGVEPFLPLRLQGIWWSVGFLLYGAFLLVCSLQTFFSYTSGKIRVVAKHIVEKNQPHIKKQTYLLWILLPAISSLMLLAITNLLTQSIASAPFLWLLPLSLYLVSFILTFSGEKWYWRNVYAYILIIFGAFALLSPELLFASLPLKLFMYSFVLFSICMICHGEVYHLKPHPERLDRYYLFIALGSAISGMFVGIIAPLFFKGFWEVYIGFYFSFVTAFAVLIRYKNSFVYRYTKKFFTTEKEALLSTTLLYPVIILIFGLYFSSAKLYDSEKNWRSFYGILSIKTKTANNVKSASLWHGSIVHGRQIFSSRYQRIPISYYGYKSGVGLALLHYPRPQDGLRVGAVGLGIGTLAAYGQKGDYYRFYEINPQVIDIAQKDFTYLKDSPADIDISIGDARLSLEKEIKDPKQKRYDILAIDAFSDDAIPFHLLTKEAFEVYLARLKPEGVIAFHISNKYVDLKPVLVQAAQHFGLQYEFIHAHTEGVAAETHWALLSYNKKVFNIPEIAKAREKENNYKKIALWTDDYSNLFQILK